MKIADHGQHHQAMQNLTDAQAGERLQKMLVRFATNTVQLDKRIKKIIAASPGDTAAVILTMDSGLQSEVTALVNLIHGVGVNHGVTGA